MKNSFLFRSFSLLIVVVISFSCGNNNEKLNKWAQRNDSLLQSITFLSAKNEGMLKKCEEHISTDSTCKDAYDKAMAARKNSDEMSQYIENIKKRMLNEAEQTDTITRLINMKNKGNKEIAEKFLNGNGEMSLADLKEKIERYKQNMLALVDPEKAELGLKWELDSVNDKSLIEILTVLTELQCAVKIDETEMLNIIYKKCQGTFLPV